MSDEPDTDTVTRLIRSLQTEADEVRTSPDAWATLQRRIDADALRRTTSRTTGLTPRRRQPETAMGRGPVSAVIALGLVVAVVLFVTTYGWQHTALPGPARPPSEALTPGAASSPTMAPTPPTSEVATTFVYYPGQQKHLQAQAWPRTTLAAAVGAISGEPAGDDVSWPFGALTLASVHESENQVVVDYSADAHIVPGKPDSSVASFWAQSLVHTVAAYEGRPMPVLVTLRGKPFRLFGLLDTSEPFRYRTMATGTTAAIALPSAVPTKDPLQIVGAVRAGVDHIAWYLVDRGSQQTLYQGAVAVGADRAYGFALAVPTGQYELRVDERTKAGARGQSYGRSVEVT